MLASCKPNNEKVVQQMTYMLVVLGTVFGTSMAYDDGLTLEQCRTGQEFLTGKVNGEPTCCIDTRHATPITEATALCPAGIFPFPYQDGDEQIFGDMALKHLR